MKQPGPACYQCQTSVTWRNRSHYYDAVKAGRAFCSKECWKITHSRESSARMTQTNIRRSKILSRRMRLHNPVHMPGVLEKICRKLRGRPFSTQRGGNGTLSGPQLRLAEATGLPMELAIVTRAVWAKFPNLPNCYKVDLAEASVRLAIEVDGNSHNTITGRARDRLKDSVLRELGWAVLRFTNAEVLNDLAGCQKKIQCIISKLKIATTTLPTAC